MTEPIDYKALRFFQINETQFAAGRHLHLDLYECQGEFSIELIEKTLNEASKATGAHVVFTYSHPFDGGSSSGVVILEESHCTWHCWVENKFIAIDIFVCGGCDPMLAIPVVNKHFQPKNTVSSLHHRGLTQVG